jgi:hypothetical protein
MIMVQPPQWSGVPASSPLAADGSDFPCQAATPNPTPVATYTAGGTGMLGVEGSATHGGGSGQMVITYDFPPTKNSVWRVMQSWEGDHPVKCAGNFPADPTMPHPPIPFAIPKQLKAGRAVIAWNWFNRIGNREEYMKCATVTIKSLQGDDSDFESLPTMFRANSGNGCIVPENTDAIAFKNPGANLVVAPNYTPTPIPCDSSQPGTSSPQSTPDNSDSTTTNPSQSGTSATNSTMTTPPQPSTSATLPTADTGNNTANYSSPASSLKPATQPSADIPTYGESTNNEGQASCIEGTVTCNSDNTWSQCGSGRNQVIGPVPAGLTCVNGAIVQSPTYAKRSIRFSTKHKHMHKHKHHRG